MKHLSDCAERLIGQSMFQLLTRVKELQSQGRDIVQFEIGDSKLGTHKHIVEATKAALDNDHTHYVSAQGIPEFRACICDNIQQTLGFQPDVEQVLIMPANSIIDAVVRCTMNPGESLIIPDPGFVTYGAVVNYTGMNGVPLPQIETDRFGIDPDQLDHLVNNDTRLIISNSPCNPTGMVLTEEETKATYDIAEKNDTYLLSDETYSRLTYDAPHTSPAIYDQCKERTIILNSFSKCYSMSGWRLGYAIGPADLIKKMTLLYETIYSCTPPFNQYAGIAALTEHQEVIEDYRTELQHLRDVTVAGLNSLPGVHCTVPAGAMYVFADMRETGITAEEFAEKALEEANVALLPGTSFGQEGVGHIRLCFARPEETIREGIKRLQEVFD